MFDGSEVSGMSEKITISDVARDAGVSLATVSRVINQKGIVKESTYNKVMVSVNKLGYVVDDGMHQSYSDSGIILFNLPSIANPFYSEILKGAKMSAQRYGYQLLISEDYINQNTLHRIQSVIKRTRAIGMITTNQISTATIRKLSDMIPVVQCCEYNESVDLPYVSVDDVQASSNVIEYLASIGKRRIGIINGPVQFKYARHRLQGYQISLEKLGIAYDPKIVVNLPDVNFELAVSAAIQLINSDNPPDAFFACSDVFACAILRAAHLNGYRVPEDFSVVGFDNIDITSTSVPSITTISQPKLQLGFTSSELLIEQIQNPSTPVKRVILETELIVRESS